MIENPFDIDKLKRIILIKRFVNCYSKEFNIENAQTLDLFLSDLREAFKKIIYVDIDIGKFENCENEEQEAAVLLEIINRELKAKELPSIATQAISIASALNLFGNSLENQALLVFHFFNDLYSEKEKNILRSIRRARRSDISSYLGILLLSNRKVVKWELFPESNLDERHVIFFEI